MAIKEKITFLASLPPIQSAIMTDGTGDSMTVKLLIPLKQCPDALKLHLMTQKVLKVTVTEAPLKDRKNADAQIETKKKRTKQRYPYRA